MAKILCIEDETPIRADIVEELKDEGFDTVEAFDGEDGLRAIVEEAPDLVLCDITMPGMSGLDVLRTLRRDYPDCAEMPFIFLTALADRESIIDGKTLGCDDYLTKPVDFGILMATVRARLDQVARMADREQTKLRRLNAEVAQATRTIHALEHSDPLTGLANRDRFLTALEQAVTTADAHHPPPAVLVLRLDSLKELTNTLGLAAGNTILTSVAGRLGACVDSRPAADGHDGGDLIARLGDDEFGVILHRCQGSNEACDLAERMIRSACMPVMLDGRDAVSSVGIGIAIGASGAGEGDAETLFRQAGIAAQRASLEGPNVYRLHDADWAAKVRDGAALRQDLRVAVPRGELVLYYQPRVDAVHGETVAAEALVRWRHPSLGMVSPDVFIPIAESSGDIHPLGRWVLEQACRDAMAWPAQGVSPPKVAVNLSPMQLMDRDIVATVRDILEDTGLQPERLELEVTEGRSMDDVDAAFATLNNLRAMGITISLDDFGTGYSSLAYLKRFPASVVKIDRSFVRHLPDDPNDAAFTNTIIDLAHFLGMIVVAEGVETENQARFLRDQGCDQLQGYLFSPPVPVEDLVRLMMARAA